MNVPAALSKCGISAANDNAEGGSVRVDFRNITLSVSDELCEFLAKRANERKNKIFTTQKPEVFDECNY